MVEVVLPRAVGSDGAAGTVAVGTVTTLPPGSPATIVNVGTASAAVLNFSLPTGPQGTPGVNGTDGTDGVDGTSATIAVGTVTTGAPGSSATVLNVGTASAAVFDFSIPRGADGSGSGDVVGPASSVDDNIALFNGATGKLLKAGALISTLAPLASPTFTGTPAAPTATAGTSTTQLATTAFVTTADNLKANLSDTLNTQTGTTYTLQASDNGKVVEFNNASSITLTLPVLTLGFNCIIRQIGAGQPSWTASGTTIRNRSGHTKLAGQWAEASISYRSTTEVVISGDTAS